MTPEDLLQKTGEKITRMVSRRHAMTDEDLAHLGLIIHQTQEKLKAALESVKGTLRERARQKETEEVIFPSSVQDEGTVRVLFLGTEIKSSPEKMERIGNLPLFLREKLFTKTVSFTPVKDFEEILNTLPPETRDEVLSCVELVESTPRVSFRLSS